MVVATMVKAKAMADFAAVREEAGFKTMEAVSGKGQMVTAAKTGFVLGMFIAHKLLSAMNS